MDIVQSCSKCLLHKGKKGEVRRMMEKEGEGRRRKEKEGEGRSRK